jgi:hypothetical protein
VGSLYPSFALIALTSGCVSLGGGTTVNVALDDSPVRRVGGTYEIGTLVEVVENELVGQLFYTRDLGPLGKSSALRSWGARLTKTQGRGLPGFYLQGAYGQNDETQSPAELWMIGAGVAFARHDDSRRGRIWTAIRGGLVYHREHQLQTNLDEVGHFLGLEIAVNVGFDILGPMYDGRR